MIRNIARKTYQNTQGQWDIEIDYEDSPVGKDVDEGIEEWYLFKILGPNMQRFTYKVSFEGTALATERLDLGLREDTDRRIDIGLEKIGQLIDSNIYVDKIVTRSYEGWTVSLSPRGLIKHSSSREIE